jgi:hypothetical protein
MENAEIAAVVGVVADIHREYIAAFLARRSIAELMEQAKAANRVGAVLGLPAVHYPDDLEPFLKAALVLTRPSQSVLIAASNMDTELAGLETKTAKLQALDLARKAVISGDDPE